MSDGGQEVGGVGEAINSVLISILASFRGV